MVTVKHAWGADRVYYQDADGHLKSLPTAWTSVAPDDPVVMISGGRSCFRVEDLIRLCEIVKRLKDTGNRAAAGERKEGEAV